MKLRNKNVLIFGGGSGMGKAIATRFVNAAALEPDSTRVKDMSLGI